MISPEVEVLESSSNVEQKIVSAVKDTLARGKKVVVDAGNNGLFSIISGGNLVIGIDPEAAAEIELPENVNSSEYMQVVGKIQDLPEKVRGKVAGVLMVAPNPLFAEEMVEQAMELVQEDGWVAVVLDIRSNKRKESKKVRRALYRNYAKDHDVWFPDSSVEASDLSGELDGINIEYLSDIVDDDTNRVLVIYK